MSARRLRRGDVAERRTSAVSRTGEGGNARRGLRLRSAAIARRPPFAADPVNEEDEGGDLAALASGPRDPRKDPCAHEHALGQVPPAGQVVEPGDGALEVIEAFELKEGGGDLEQSGDLPPRIARAKASRR